MLADFGSAVAVDFSEGAIRKIFESTISFLTKVLGITRSGH